MDSMFNFDFHIDSTLNNDTNNTLDWSAFQLGPAISSSNNSFLQTYISPHDDAVAPDNKSNVMITPSYNDDMYYEVEHFFNGLNQQYEQGIKEPMHISDQTKNDIKHIETLHRIHLSSTVDEKPSTCLPTPLVPCLSSSRSQCYHKLPDHAVKLMQEWYNANIDDPYPRSPDKKRFITEGNITAQQCRSWFANRRQRLKHVKRNQVRSSSSRVHRTIHSKLPTEEPTKIYENCQYCQQQCLTYPSMTRTTTFNVVINHQTVEQLIHNSLRKLLYPIRM